MAPELRIDTGLQQRLEQRLKLAPQIIQSIEILQLPTMALEELVHQEMADNPVLEMEEAGVSPDGAPEEPNSAPAEEEPEDPIQREIDEEWREFFGERPRRPDQEASDRKQQAMLNTAARPVSLQEYVLAQFRLLEVDERTGAAGADIIQNLDDSGYLRTPLEELAGGSEGRFSLEDAEEALGLVQTLDPPGVGARDIRECLLLQISPGENDLARELIEGHLEDVEENRLPQVSKKTGRSIDEIKEAVKFISHLNPRPGAAISGSTAPRIVPDVVVEYTDDGYEVRLEDNYVPNLAISRLYEKLAASKDAAESTRKYLKDKIRSARWLIDAIEQRKTTLYRVACAIVEFQKYFLDCGLSSLRPLRMQEVADEVGVHVSTVSRAIADKYIQTPRGIFPLKYFFTGGITDGGGEGRTWRTVKQEIKDLIEAEDSSDPLSDEEVAEKLEEKGYSVARRTVAKYRKALGIPSSRRRKSY